ncbi:MAG: hypothetical protein GX549_03945, partial [Clostridiales bacterium]|nr:hypothetical protein [Clostridiales bacterium]
MSDWINLLPNTIREKYELYNLNHAVEILAQAYRDEYKDIISALEMFSISLDDIRHGGGNESEIPRKFSNFL